ncbi:MAG: FAD-dependent oxidoreductase, partial [Methyloceanibacter sp.]
ELSAWGAGHNVPLHVFDWRPEHDAAGLARDAIYLIRPDTYVALADTSGAPNTLNRYYADHGIRLLASSP